MIKYQNNISSY